VALDMARRRKRGLRPWVSATLTGIAVTTGLACLIMLANEVTLLRTEIGDLGQKRTTLVVRKAMLLARWNESAAQSTIVARATTELGLMSPPDPGHVLVLTTPARSHDPELWRRVVAAIGGGENVAVAAAAGERP
jgi:hypothetical protein